jgi:hypothetical protein
METVTGSIRTVNFNEVNNGHSNLGSRVSHINSSICHVHSTLAFRSSFIYSQVYTLILSLTLTRSLSICTIFHVFQYDILFTNIICSGTEQLKALSVIPEWFIEDLCTALTFYVRVLHMTHLQRQQFEQHLRSRYWMNFFGNFYLPSSTLPDLSPLLVSLAIRLLGCATETFVSFFFSFMISLSSHHITHSLLIDV